MTLRGREGITEIRKEDKEVEEAPSFPRTRTRSKNT